MPIICKDPMTRYDRFIMSLAPSEGTRTMALIIPITTMTPTSQVASTSKICTTGRNVCLVSQKCLSPNAHDTTAAKKEDNPEEALKDFQAIVEQEEEKGDWYARKKQNTTYV